MHQMSWSVCNNNLMFFLSPFPQGLWNVVLVVLFARLGMTGEGIDWKRHASKEPVSQDGPTVPLLQAVQQCVHVASHGEHADCLAELRERRLWRCVPGEMMASQGCHCSAGRLG